MTGEFNDLTGIVDCLIALQRTVVLEGSSRWMAVRMTRGYVEVVEQSRAIDQIRWDVERQLRQQLGDHMAPRLLAAREVNRFHRLLRRLVSRETGPLVTSVAPRCARLIEVSFRLSEPVACAIRHALRSL